MEYALSELFTLQMGKTPSRDNSSYWKKSENNWISIADLTNSGKYISNTKETLSDSAVAESGIKKIPANTVIMSFKLSLGKVAITEKEMYSNEAIMAFIDKGVEKISPEYLYYLLRAKDWSNGTNKAVMGATLNKATLSTIKIQLHEYDNQLGIVNMLNRVSSSIDFRKQQLTKLDELIKARFVEMFGDPYTNSKDYPLKKGESFFKLSNGKAVPESKRLNGGIPAYGGNGISWYTDESLFDADTIVVGRVGFQSGNVHLVKGPLWVTDNAMYMSSCDFSQYNLTFLIELMAHVDFTKFQDAGDLKKITQKPFMQFEYLCPPLSLQNQFSAFVAEVDKSKLLVGSAAAHKPFDIGFFSQKHCATPCKRGIISSKHVIFH